MNITVTNPATGMIDNTYPLMDQAAVDAILQRMDIAQKTWAQTALQTKIELMQKAAVNLSDHKQQYAAIITAEMGKPISQAVAEIEKCASLCDYYCANVENLLQNKLIKTNNTKSYVCYHPLGVVGIISAFNFPVAVWSWNVALAWICGNVTVWKPSEKTPVCSIVCQRLIAEVFKENNIPEGVSCLLNGGSEIGKQMASDKRIALVSATGSTSMGRSVATTVAERLGKSLLELGGNNAVIVTPDADLKMTIIGAVF